MYCPNLFYTYVLIDPRTDLPFYVGKGRRYRILAHGKYKERSNPKLYNKFTKIVSDGYEVIAEKWFESEDEDLCYWVDIYLIDHFGIKNLCNAHPGGLGGAPTEKSRKTMSERMSGKSHPFYGKTIPSATRDKISKTLKGVSRINSGTFKPGAFAGENNPAKRPEVRQKIKEGRKGQIPPMTGHHHSEESKQKSRLSNLGKKHVGGGSSTSFKKGHVSWITGKKGLHIGGRKKGSKNKAKYEDDVLNALHARGITKSNTSGFKGVTKAGKKWQASLSSGGKHCYLGIFDTKEEAALVYDKAARERFGEAGYQNFPKWDDRLAA